MIYIFYSKFYVIGVAGGNAITFQRVIDVISETLNIMANSQGDCNNFTFGASGKDPVTGVASRGFGNYETIVAATVLVKICG